MRPAANWAAFDCFVVAISCASYTVVVACHIVAAAAAAARVATGQRKVNL